MDEPTPICAKCGNLGFLVKKGKRVQCACVVQRRARIYLRKLQPLTPMPECLKALKEADHKGNILVRIPETFQDIQQAKWIFAYLLLRGGILRTYQLVSASELLLAHFGENEEFKSPQKVNADILCLLYGFYETRHPMQGEVILQTLEMRSVRGKQNWVMIRGRPTFSAEVESYARGRKYTEIVLGYSGKAPPTAIAPSAPTSSDRDGRAI